MIYYISFYIFTIMSGVLYHFYRNKIFLLIVVFAAILFSGFRYDAGNDFFSYYAILTGEKIHSDLEFFSNNLVNLSKYLNEPYIFYFLTSLIYMALMVYGLHKFNALGFSSLILLLFFAASWLTSFGYVRQFVAISLLFLATAYLVKGKDLKFFFFTILAFLFHKSAVIGGLIYFYYKVFGKKEHALSIYLLCYLFFYFVFVDIIFFITSFVGFYHRYIVQPTNSDGFGIFLVLTFLFIVQTCLAKFFKIRDRNFWVANNLFFLGVVIYASLLNFGEYVVRVAYFLVPFVYVSTFFLLKNMKGRVRIFYFGLIFSLTFFTYFYTLYLASNNPTRDFLTNYKFYFLL
ncbi:EpsG family protein [Vreelandella boliviensis]|nr:EpsG family protein [Halomonas boliviensis]OZT73690.1 EpsG family protein [Halomonas boliviensis LC1]